MLWRVPAVNRLHVLSDRAVPPAARARELASHLEGRAAEVRHAARRVALVCMPFQAIELPSIALGTLAEVLRKDGHVVDVVHLNLDFAAHIGVGAYTEIASYASWLRLFGEWLFADDRAARGSASPGEYAAYLRRHPWRDRARELERFDLGALRREADRALLRWFQARDWGAYDVVGFTLMFQQINASLRLGERIKAASPRTRVIFGGSAVESPMGQPLLDRHPWIDAVFSGYAEHSLPAYVAALPPRDGRVITQQADFALDELPIPDFETFFADVKRLGLARTADFSVPIETSRGCWWGEKHHCIFCALNALDMKQRNKGEDRVLREIAAQSRYGLPFFATDNILPLEFFKGLFPRLIAAGLRFDTFYETKSNLSLAQLRMLRDAGVNCIQPGVESLSTPILKYMKKGVSAAQNLFILRAAEEMGLGVAWSILYGFPEEDPAEYARMTAMLPALSHLPPPLRPAPVLLERYSPLFDKAETYGLTNVRPTFAHRAAFGDAQGLRDRAYVFDFEYGDGRRPDTYTHPLNEGVAAWMEARARLLSPRCEVFCVGALRVVFDSRDLCRVGRAWPRVHVLSDVDWELVRLTDELTSESKLRESWTHHAPLDPVLLSFLRRRWLVRIDGRLVRVLMRRDQPFLGAELRRAARGGLRRADRLQRRLRAHLGARAMDFLRTGS
jgi:ribosomal peptide maturation radical SAM protein 1